MTYDRTRPHPWHLKFADQGGSRVDLEVRMRSYPTVVGAAVKAGELAWRFARSIYIENRETGERIEVRKSGQVRVIR